MRTEFPGDLRAPASARRFAATPLRELLGSADRPSTEDVLLVISELVTNSVRADATAIALSLEIDEERVEVTVTDDAAGWPAPRDAGWDDAHGRGLAIVDHLADRWHTTALDRGKSVTVTWFRDAALSGAR